MICNLIRCVAFAQLLAFCSAKFDAAVIWKYDLNNLWPLDTAGSSGTSFSQPKGIVDGSFSLTASLVVTGSNNIRYLATASGGVGINGNTLNGSSSAESSRFSILALHEAV